VQESSVVRVDLRTQRLIGALRALGARSEGHVAAAQSRLEPALRRVADASALLVPVGSERLGRAIGTRFVAAESRLSAKQALLEALSPSRTVGRGYAIVRDPVDGHPLVSVGDLRAGDRVELEMRDGRVDATVEGARG
jgi:exodeoxyribonuclease VII large subunit